MHVEIDDAELSRRRTAWQPRRTGRLAGTLEKGDALRSHRAELGAGGEFAAAPEIEAEPLLEKEIVVGQP